MEKDEDLMASPICIKLTEIETGKFYTFGSMIQTSEFLQRSKQYLQVRINSDEVTENDIAVGYDGTKYRIEICGTGRRKDAGTAIRKPYVRNLTEAQKKRYAKSLQLCSDCARAVGFCSWSKNLTPVEGWTAEPSMISHYNKKHGKVIEIREVPSYHVIWCPLFMKDGKTKEERREHRRMLLEEIANDT